MVPELWKLGKYPEFLEERRKLLAGRTRFLDSLASGTVPEDPASIGSMERLNL